MILFTLLLAASQALNAQSLGYQITEGPCSVDYSAAPESRDLAQAIADTCATYFPNVQAIMQNPRALHPQLVLTRDLPPKVVGRTNGELVRLEVDHFTQHPDDLGAVVHELAHVDQSYPPNYPGQEWHWLKESIADFVRADAYDKDARWSARCGPNDTYLKGYGCGAALLLYAEKRVRGHVVLPLVQALRESRFTGDEIVQLTGKDWPSLYSECLAADCSGGAPILSQ